jgi:hypothetical protein
MADLPPYPGTPRWVKVSGIVVGVLVLVALFVVLTGIGGPHGPGRLMRSDGTGGQTPPSSFAKEPTPPGGGLAGHTPPEGGHR